VLEARVVAVMARTISPEEKAIGGVMGADGVKRPALPPRIRVTDQRMGTTEDAPLRKVFDARSEAAMKSRIEETTGRSASGVSIEPATPGHGRDALGQRLSALVAKGPARSHEGKPVRDAEDIRDVTRDWGRHLRSQTPRDTMHMVVSAKAGTDVKDFTNAVRSFLHDRFSDHKFMFGVHTDKAEAGHIHAHVFVAVRSEHGTKLQLGPSDLAQLRVTYAAHAREHGLQVVATRAAEQASSRSYGPKDKSIVDAATTPRAEREEQDRAYASDPRNASLIRNAQERMETARANPIRIPETERERVGVKESLAHWREEARANPGNELAKSMVQRLAVANEAGAALSSLKQATTPEDRKPSQPALSETPAPAMTHQPKSASDMLQDLRLLNQKAADVAALLPEGSRAKFLERAGTYLEKIAERVDQQRAEEAKAQAERKAQERQAMKPVVEKAEQVARAEAREAQQAVKAAGRAVEAERKVEGAPLSESGTPLAIDQKRALVREAERQAATENDEARDATEVARSVAADPTKPIQTAVAASANDRVAEIRRKQAEMLEKLSKERTQASEREKGHEQGD
ncbi:MAG: relaxase/mobilization nuclease domain-containing protein, partial [Aestuariivirga sp.]